MGLQAAMLKWLFAQLQVTNILYVQAVAVKEAVAVTKQLAAVALVVLRGPVFVVCLLVAQVVTYLIAIT